MSREGYEGNEVTNREDKSLRLLRILRETIGLNLIIVVQRPDSPFFHIFSVFRGSPIPSVFSVCSVGNPCLHSRSSASIRGKNPSLKILQPPFPTPARGLDPGEQFSEQVD